MLGLHAINSQRFIRKIGMDTSQQYLFFTWNDNRWATKRVIRNSRSTTSKHGKYFKIFFRRFCRPIRFRSNRLNKLDHVVVFRWEQRNNFFRKNKQFYARLWTSKNRSRTIIVVKLLLSVEAHKLYIHKSKSYVSSFLRLVSSTMSKRAR